MRYAFTLDCAATRTALAVARALTNYEDDRIPDRVPTEMPHIGNVLSVVRDVADGYAHRAQHLVRGPLADHDALLRIRSAHQICQAVTAFAQTAAADPSPSVTEVDALLMAILTWKMADGEDPDVVRQIGAACASFTAGQIAVERDLAAQTAAEAGEPFNPADRPTVDEVYERVARAVDAMSPDERENLALEATATQLAHDAYGLGQRLLALGDVDGARHWLAVAHIHGVTEAAMLIPEFTKRDQLPYDPDEPMSFTADPEGWLARADQANRTAIFFPVTTPESTSGDDVTVDLPRIQVAGIQAYLYLNAGRVRLSLDLDDTESWLVGDDSTIPVEITVNDRLRLVLDGSDVRLVIDNEDVYVR